MPNQLHPRSGTQSSTDAKPWAGYVPESLAKVRKGRKPVSRMIGIDTSEVRCGPHGVDCEIVPGQEQQADEWE